MNEQAEQLRQMRVDRTLGAPTVLPQWVSRASRKATGMYGLPLFEDRYRDPHLLVWGLVCLVVAPFVAIFGWNGQELRSNRESQDYWLVLALLLAAFLWLYVYAQRCSYAARMRSRPECATLIFQPGMEQLVLIPRGHSGGYTATLVLREIIEETMYGRTTQRSHDVERIPLPLLYSASPKLFQTTLLVPVNALPSFEEGHYQLQWGLELERSRPAVQFSGSFFLIWVTTHDDLAPSSGVEG